MKSLTICVGLIFFQQLSGINVVLFNAQSIFEDAKTGLDPATSAILLGVVQVIACGLTPFIVDRLGRKPLLVTSCIVASITLTLMGSYFYLKDRGDDIQYITWLPVTALIIYMLVYCFGLGPLPWAISGEMFPSDIKSIAAPIVASVCWLLGFITTRFYPNLNAIGPYVAFFLFGGFSAVAVLFVVFVVLETKGLSLHEIQVRLNK